MQINQSLITNQIIIMGKKNTPELNNSGVSYTAKRSARAKVIIS